MSTDFFAAVISGARIPSSKEEADGEVWLACQRLKKLKPASDQVFPVLDHLLMTWPKEMRPDLRVLSTCWRKANESAERDDECIVDDGQGVPVLNPGPFPARLLAVPGIIADWTAWINATSHRQQPVLALAAVITACGALIGRRLETESGGRANIYALGLCETGGGKDRARQAVKEVFVEAGIDALLGPEDLASEAGLVGTLVLNPCQLFQIDEIGKLLSAIASPQSAPHLVGITSALLKLYSSANTVFKGKAYADSTKNPVIQQPHACLYGTATPDATWASLGQSAVEDGFIGRLWAFVADDQKPPRSTPIRQAPPASLMDAIKTWCHPAGRSIVGDIKNPGTVAVKRTPEAQAILNAFEARTDAEEERLKKNPLAKLWTRAAQKADQLSLVYAWSDSLDPIVDADAAQWAVDLADYLTRSLLWHVQRHIASNQTESDVKRVLRIIEDEGGVMRLSALTRRTQWLNSRVRKEILSTLEDGAQIVMSNEVTAGRTATVIRLLK